MGDYREYINEIKKVDGPRKHKIRNSLGVYDAYKYYRKNKPKDTRFRLTESQYFAIIRNINELLKDEILKGHDITFPHRMGKLELRKFNSKVEFKDGKLRTNLPIDWDRTLKLWYEDKEAEKEKTLIRIETNELFTIYYNRASADFPNKAFYKFNVNRALKRMLKDRIRNNNIDALYLGKNIKHE